MIACRKTREKSTAPHYTPAFARSLVARRSSLATTPPPPTPEIKTSEQAMPLRDVLLLLLLLYFCFTRTPYIEPLLLDSNF